MIVLFIIVAVIVLGLILHFLFPLIQVCGNSMYPTYHDGEILIGCRLFSKKRRKVGEVIVYHSPDNKVVIKRIEEVVNSTRGCKLYYCLGDNSDESYDSRYYGAISSKKLVCRILNQRRKQ